MRLLGLGMWGGVVDVDYLALIYPPGTVTV